MKLDVEMTSNFFLIILRRMAEENAQFAGFGHVGFSKYGLIFNIIRQYRVR
jgi:hypothetical protein